MFRRLACIAALALLAPPAAFAQAPAAEQPPAGGGGTACGQALPAPRASPVPLSRRCAGYRPLPQAARQPRTRAPTAQLGQLAHSRRSGAVSRDGLAGIRRCRRLRRRGERPSRDGSADTADELPPSHSITSSARPRSDSGTLRPSVAAVLRFRISSALVVCWTGIPYTETVAVATVKVRFRHEADLKPSSA